jgi:hypothetical protein
MTSSSLDNIRHVASQTIASLDSIVFPTLPTDYRVRDSDEPEDRSGRCCARVWNGGMGGQCSRPGGFVWIVAQRTAPEQKFCAQHHNKMITFQDTMVNVCKVSAPDPNPLYAHIGGVRVPKWRLGFIGQEVPMKEMVTEESGWRQNGVERGKVKIGQVYPMNKTAGKWKAEVE